MSVQDKLAALEAQMAKLKVEAAREAASEDPRLAGAFEALESLSEGLAAAKLGLGSGPSNVRFLLASNEAKRDVLLARLDLFEAIVSEEASERKAIEAFLASAIGEDGSILATWDEYERPDSQIEALTEALEAREEVYREIRERGPKAFRSEA